MTTIAAGRLPETLQPLIDARLDTIERMLLGRVPRADRIAIVQEVEAQIHELLEHRDPEEWTREELLGVLARLDPPEAYLPEPGEGVRAALAPARELPPRTGTTTTVRKRAFLSGVLGIICLAGVICFMPLVWFVALAFGSELVLFLGVGVIDVAALALGVVAIVMSIHARRGGAWAITGLVTGILGLLLAVVLSLGLIVMVL